MERTFVMIKPGAVQRELVGEIISRFEKKGIKIVGLKIMRMSEELANKHYGEHVDKAFFPELVSSITAGPLVALVLEGNNVIKTARKMAGATRAEDAVPGTIRGDYVLDTGKNVVHTSDSEESSKREISLFFEEDEILDYSLATEEWIYVLPSKN